MFSIILKFNVVLMMLVEAAWRGPQEADVELFIGGEKQEGKFRSETWDIFQSFQVVLERLGPKPVNLDDWEYQFEYGRHGISREKQYNILLSERFDVATMPGVCLWSALCSYFFRESISEKPSHIAVHFFRKTELSFHKTTFCDEWKLKSVTTVLPDENGEWKGEIIVEENGRWRDLATVPKKSEYAEAIPGGGEGPCWEDHRDGNGAGNRNVVRGWLEHRCDHRQGDEEARRLHRRGKGGQRVGDEFEN